MILTRFRSVRFVGWMVWDRILRVRWIGLEDTTEMDIKGFVFEHLRGSRYMMCGTCVAIDLRETT